MLRYVAFSWDPLSEAQFRKVAFSCSTLVSRSSAWSRIFSAAGLLVYCTADRVPYKYVHQLADGSGVVLGAVFENEEGEISLSSYKPVSVIPDVHGTGCSSTSELLIKRLWGRYVAFLTSQDPARRLIVRSPATGLPCYLAHAKGGIAIFFSDAEAYSDLPLSRLSINWSYIRRKIALGSLRSRETGLEDVMEVQNGECVEHSSTGCVYASLWSPYSATKNPCEDPNIASQRLHDTAKACAQAWRSCHPTILHRLSGGLDSSIVLSCLANPLSSGNITSVNYFVSRVNSSDERRYARLAAETCGSELVERDRGLQTVDMTTLLAIPLSTSPYTHLGTFETMDFERELCRSKRATAISSGDPGDALFCRFHLDLALIDLVRRRGLTREVVRFAERAAQVEGLSIWTLLRRALHQRLSMSSAALFLSTTSSPARPLVNPELTAGAAKISHYELDPMWPPPTDVPPGKLLQIMAVLTCSPAYFPIGWHSTDAEELHPLFSQPLLELCLRIPSYLHCRSGVSRGLARSAFSNDLPGEVLNRLWKGRPGRHSKDVVTSNLKFVKDLLLSGNLVKERFLDKAQLEDALSGHATQSKSHALHVLEYLLVEVWLEGCRARSTRAAA